ncbi:MAG: hypothetical protein RLZZ28_164, partial [Bacteroidota bacterium]
MKKISLFSFLLLFLSATQIFAQAKISPELEGRWDLTIHNKGGKELPSWLEINHSGNRTLTGRFVSVSGSARPVAKIVFTKPDFSFSIPAQWEGGSGELMLQGTLDGDKMTGSIVYPDGSKNDWSGIQAPKLSNLSEPKWDKPVALFNGKDLTGWHALGKVNQWVVENGVLRSPKSGSNICTDEKFTDFKLHVEFKYPAGSNSGVYLRGRYEVQIEDSKGLDPLIDLFGAVYGFIAPNEMAANAAGEWQTYDITLIGRTVTVVANGKTIICKQPIPGITGGALDSNESEAGPIYFQGDHGPVEFRNIVITK